MVDDQSNDSDPPERPKVGNAPVKKKRGCLFKLFFYGLIFLFILAFLINGPIFRWAVSYGIKFGAEKIGLEGEVTVKGSILSGLELNDVEFTGDGTGPVSSLSLRNARVDYSLIDLIKTGGLTWLEEVRLSDANVIVALKDTPKEPEPEEEDDGKPSILWQLLETRYEIENINVTVTKGDKTYKVANFNLSLPSSGQGKLSIDRLEIPGADPREGISTDLKTTPTSLELGPLRPLDDVEITSLTLNQAAKGEPLLMAVLGLSGGSVEASYTVDGPISAELVSGAISLPELVRLAQVDDLQSGTVTKLDLLLEGKFDEPETLSASLDLDLESVQWADMANLGQAKLGAEIRGDFLTFESIDSKLSLEIGGGQWMDMADLKMAKLNLELTGGLNSPVELKNGELELSKVRWIDMAEIDHAKFDIDFSGDPYAPETWSTGLTLNLDNASWQDISNVAKRKLGTRVRRGFPQAVILEFRYNAESDVGELWARACRRGNAQSDSKCR